ncbi:hypothetical protein GCM10011505_08780 [Tistrella bauzanensis]|uniref:Phytanoyl-CoA dioxygenase n=1 Tax=Tistrella bauzanensis TaxID=657419 RepID=A0ABQ1IAI3_9PROT|nr:DUF6445 family protein [Tistrella bauzanensis]GGB29672.1 hypothetical protein GCM10011505_08780 [Tistrella bauzanensis]
MHQSMIVVDDFYENPLEVRAQALALDYPMVEGPGIYFPGRNSRQFMLPPDSDRMFSYLVREPVAGNRGMAHGKCRLSYAADTRAGVVHIDPGCAWAGIVFLSLDEHARGGTEFFRHKETGTDRAPLSNEEAQAKFGCATPDEVLDTVLKRDGGDRSKWDLQMVLPMKFNRLILFRPWLWHTSGEDFGDRPENGRLVQILFFKPGAASAAARPQR